MSINTSTDSALETPRAARNKSQWVILAVSILAISAGVIRYASQLLSKSDRARQAKVELPEVDVNGLDPAVLSVILDAQNVVVQLPRSASAWGRLGSVLLAHSFDVQANTCLAKAEELDPGEPRWPYFQALATMKEDADHAIGKLRRTVQLCGDTPDAPRLQLAELLLSQDKLDPAQEQFQLSLGHYPGHARAQVGLARIALRKGQLKQSRELLEKALLKAPNRKEIHTLLAEVCLRLKDNPSAEREQELTRAMPVDPSWHDAFLGEIDSLRTGKQAALSRSAKLMKSGRYQEVVDLMEAATKSYPDSDWAWLTLGTALLQLDKFDQADPALRTAVRLAPENPETHYRLAMGLTMQKKYDEALESLRTTQSLRTDYAPPYYTMGYCLEQKNDLPGAIEAYENAIQRQVDYFEAHVRLAIIQKQQGNLDAARQAATRALEIKPGNAEVQKFLDDLATTETPTDTEPTR